jgi:NADH-ubiquinone oxidoreductase chain 6
MTNFLIDLLAFGTLISSVLVITSKNPVIAVVYLISTFVNAAGYLILIGVGFIGISYIIIYIGAITVLFLFVIMMINIKLTDILETGSAYTKNIPLALSVGFLFIYEFFTVMPFTFNNASGIFGLLEILTDLNKIFLNVPNLLNGSFTEEISSMNWLFTVYNSTISDTAFINILQIEAIGQGLYTYGALWLLILSIILLLSMVAVIFISKK